MIRVSELSTLPERVADIVRRRRWTELGVVLSADCSFEDPERAFADRGSYVRFEELAWNGVGPNARSIDDVIVDGNTVLLIQHWGAIRTGPYRQIALGYRRRYHRDLVVVDRLECHGDRVVAIHRHFDHRAIAAARTVPAEDRPLTQRLRDTTDVLSAEVQRLWWVFILAIGVCVAPTWAYASVFTVPLYESNMSIVITPHNPDVDLAAQNVLRQYAAQLDTNVLAESVRKVLKTNQSAADLLREVSVVPVPDEMLIQLAVRDPNPVRAQRIATAWVDDFVVKHQAAQLVLDPPERLDAMAMDTAGVGRLVWPPLKLLLGTAAFLGLVIACVIVGLVAIFDPKIRSEDVVSSVLRLEVLGRIPEESLPSAAAGARPTTVVPRR